MKLYSPTLRIKVLLLGLLLLIQHYHGQKIIQRIDPYTNDPAKFQEVKNYADGSPMNASKVDGIIYIQDNRIFYRRIVSGPVNVKWFGAKGDGDRNDLGTDDTRSIQNALRILEKAYPVYDLTGGNLMGGFTLYFPAGKYLIDQTFILPSNCTVAGDDFATTVIHARNPRFIFTNVGGFYPNGVDMIMNSGINIRNLTLKQGGIDLQQAVSSRIENVRIMNLFGDGTDTGIAVKLSVDLRLKNVKVFRSTGTGILFQETLGGKLSTTTSFDQVWVSHCKTGMLVDGSDGAIGIISSGIQNSIFEYNEKGVVFKGKVSHFSLRDVHFEQNSVHALEVDGNVNLVVDNVFGDEVGDLFISGSRNSQISNRIYLRNFTIPYKTDTNYRGKVVLQN